jgi:hypothetical protein
LRKIHSTIENSHRKWRRELESLKKDRGIEIAFVTFETMVIFETALISK